MTAPVLHPTERVLLQSWLARQDDDRDEQYADAMAVPTAVSIHVPTPDDADDPRPTF